METKPTSRSRSAGTAISCQWLHQKEESLPRRPKNKLAIKIIILTFYIKSTSLNKISMVDGCWN
ncbi:hypothetical protein BS78_08G168600 [Paspalum vaginatum]|nr:hypothetical protein BS78_08G168600 [Paspalum vaginatum]